MNKKLSVKYLIAALLILVSFIGGVFIGVDFGSTSSRETTVLDTFLKQRNEIIESLDKCLKDNSDWANYCGVNKTR